MATAMIHTKENYEEDVRTFKAPPISNCYSNLWPLSEYRCVLRGTCGKIHRRLLKRTSTSEKSLVGVVARQIEIDNFDPLKIINSRMRLLTIHLLAFLLLAFSPAARAQSAVPTFAISQEESSINFHVNASVALDGAFDKWNATFTVTSTEATTGVL